MSSPTPSPISRLLTTAGATTANHSDREIAVHFGDCEGETRSARKRAVLFDRNDRVLLTVAGPDAARFLHGMVTNDVQGLREGTGNYSCHLNAQGRILADFHLWRMPDHFLLETDASRAAPLRDSLDRHVIADKVEIADVSTSLCAFALHGPDSTSLLTRAAGHDPPATAYGHRWMMFGDATALAAPLDEIGGAGYRIICTHANAAAVWNHLLNAGQPDGCIPAGFDALGILRTEAGIPWTNHELTESTLPPEARLEGVAISYDKGCYLGQEIIERIRSRGSVHNLLCGFLLDASRPPAAGAELSSSGKHVGTLTTVAHSPNLEQTIALGYVRREQSTPGTRLELAGGTATVAEIPFLPIPH